MLALYEEKQVAVYREILLQCQCGGLITNGVEVFLSSDLVLFIAGSCNTCHLAGTASFHLYDLFLNTPEKCDEPTM